MTKKELLEAIKNLNDDAIIYVFDGNEYRNIDYVADIIAKYDMQNEATLYLAE